ncbi:hypothetical protein BC826DRAFT_678575 [Russula brevipes]|nr:hypothetical protein BC826DRAFT_678575 [Russula brevipes]
MTARHSICSSGNNGLCEGVARARNDLAHRGSSLRVLLEGLAQQPRGAYLDGKSAHPCIMTVVGTRSGRTPDFVPHLLLDELDLSCAYQIRSDLLLPSLTPPSPSFVPTGVALWRRKWRAYQSDQLREPITAVSPAGCKCSRVKITEMSLLSRLAFHVHISAFVCLCCYRK